MQTFLPYPTVSDSALVLDDKRLNQQVNEALQIYKTLTGRSDAWGNHPAVKMWRGYTEALTFYHDRMLWEWLSRKDTRLINYFRTQSGQADIYKREFIFGDFVTLKFTWPWWIGNTKFHSVHRANLLRKFPEHYKQFGWDEEPLNGYLWPDYPGSFIDKTS